MSDTEGLAPKNRTLYVRAQDAPVWAKAEDLAGPKSISRLVAELLGQWVAGREAEAQARKTGMGRVVLDVQQEGDDGFHKVAFQGRSVGVGFIEHGVFRGPWTVYLTAQGRLAAHGEADGQFYVYKNFNGLERVFGEESPSLMARVAESLGQAYVQELDI
jgi:hypothetical protein